jgi:hypothetical protein
MLPRLKKRGPAPPRPAMPDIPSTLTPAMARWLADALLVVHASFIAWVITGGFAVRRWPRLVWLHLPAAAWAVWISISGGLCPLTPWEWALRQRAGQGGFEGGFIEHYLLAWIYPEGLTPTIQWALALLVVAVTGWAYAPALRRLADRFSRP